MKYIYTYLMVVLLLIVAGCQQDSLAAEPSIEESKEAEENHVLSVPEAEKSNRSPEEEMAFMKKLFELYEVDTKIWSNPDLISMEIGYEGITVQLPIENPKETKVEPYLGTFLIAPYQRDGNTLTGEITQAPADRPDWEGKNIQLEKLDENTARLIIDKVSTFTFTAMELQPLKQFYGTWESGIAGETWEIREGFANTLKLQNAITKPFVISLREEKDNFYTGTIFNPLYGTGVEYMGEEISIEVIDSSTLELLLPDIGPITLNKIKQ